MPTLHQMPLSGNCYKVRLAARQLDVPLTLVEYPLFGGRTRQPEFLARNPNGRVPLLELEDGRVLPESGAILNWLADGTDLLPTDRWARAEVLQWMFFEQYSHEPYIAVARFWLGLAPEAERKAKLHLADEWHAKGSAALGVMETHLSRHDWFAAGRYTIADIALYGYTHCAADGGFELGGFPRVCAWLERVRAVPCHVAMKD